MAPRASADEKLERVLYVLPAAARGDGARLEELAEELDVRRRRVLRDLEEVTARAFYHRSGGADRLQIAVDEERVSVWTAGEFERPVKFSPGEVMALHMALRARAAAEADGSPEAAAELARELERDLAVSAPDRPGALAVEGEGRDEPAGDVRSVLFRAAREGRCCRVRYLSSGAREPYRRVLAPFTMVYSDGTWYALAARGDDVGGSGGSSGDDAGSGGGRGRQGTGSEPEVRVYRADRVLEARLTDRAFEVPDGFDPGDYLTGRVPYRADDPQEVTVRYSPRIAPWIREKGPVEEHDDGSVTVTHPVSDPDWLVRHVLRYGPEAEVLEPAEMRRRVAGAARRIAEAGGVPAR